LVDKVEMVLVRVAATDPLQLHLNGVLHHAAVAVAAETGRVLEPQQMAETVWLLSAIHQL
jgi:hypothetical protein